MPITYKKTVAVLDGVCAVEDAEELWIWLAERPKARVNLKTCAHIHSAVLQVLMKARPTISPVPEKKELAAWIMPVLTD